MFMHILHIYLGWYWSKCYQYYYSKWNFSRNSIKPQFFFTCGAVYCLVILVKIVISKIKITFLYFWSFRWIRDLNDQTKHQHRAQYPNFLKLVGSVKTLPKSNFSLQSDILQVKVSYSLQYLQIKSLHIW